jgi:hypothetical protein
MKVEFVVALDVDLHWTVVFLHWTVARTFSACKLGVSGNCLFAFIYRIPHASDALTLPLFYFFRLTNTILMVVPYENVFYDFSFYITLRPGSATREKRHSLYENPLPIAFRRVTPPTSVSWADKFSSQFV